MCAACVAQGVAYVGGALAGLQVMAARASAKRRRSDGSGEPEAEPVTEAEAQGEQRDDEPSQPGSALV